MTHIPDALLEIEVEECRARIKSYVDDIKRMQVEFEKENAEFLISEKWKNQKAAALRRPTGDQDIHEYLEEAGADMGEANDKGWNL